MSRWKVLESAFGKAGKSGDDFPAIKKLLEKERKIESDWATNNPVIGDDKLFDVGFLKGGEPGVNTDTIIMGFEEPGRDFYKFAQSNWSDHEPHKGWWTWGDNDYDSELIEIMREQPIFWADETASASGKIGPNIENALIKERETERLFNTNNPLTEIGLEDPRYVVELFERPTPPSGLPAFGLKEMELTTGLSPRDPNFKKADEEQLQAVIEQLRGKRFFFPAKGKIKDKEFAGNLYGTPSGKLEASSGDANSMLNVYDYLPSVFFADGSTI